MNIRNVAVFCGASRGYDSKYAEAAKEAGRYLASKNINIIFGGGKIGMMGALADAALQAGGEVTGVIPELLRHEEVEHGAVTRMLVVKSMSERKVEISKLADAYIALPGGFGTLDEIFEALTLGQLGIEAKPVGLLNIGGFFDPLLLQLDKMTEEGFLKKENRNMVLTADNMPELCSIMQSYSPPKVSKIIHTVGS